MNYDLVAGIFFGVAISLTGYLFHVMGRVRKIDLNLVTRANENEQKYRDWDVNDIRSDIDRIYNSMDTIESRLDALETKPKTKK
jgi:hypothetical protein